MRIVLLITAFIALVSAYGESGPFERMFYYYVYRLDIAVNGGTPSKIATRCAAFAKKKPPKFCTFNEFNRFIWGKNEEEAEKMNSWEVTNIDLPTAEDMARVSAEVSDDPYKDKGLKSTYDCNAIRANNGFNNLEKLISDLTGFATGNLEKVDDAALKEHLRTGLYTSIKEVRSKRTAAKIKAMRTDLNFIIVTTEVETYTGAPEDDKMTVVDWTATEAANTQMTKQEMRAKVKQWTDKNHEANIKAAAKACSDIHGCLFA